MKPIYFVICIQIICVCSFFNLAHANERIFLTSVNDKIFIENAILSKPTNFWNELENGLCFLLSVDSQDIGYVSSIQKTKSKTILYMCNEYDDKSENSETSKYGEIGKPVQLLLKGNSWNTEGIDYPDSQFWPYGTYCNDYFAYWGIKPNGDFFANVYDLTKRKLIANLPLGNISAETDYFEFLNYPIWDSDCNSVLYKKHDYLNADIKVNIDL